MTDDLLPDLITAIEQQLLSPETPYVAKAFKRLCELGIDPTEAKNQLAICLGEEMERILTSRKPFDQAAYRSSLESLPFPEEDPI